MIVEVNNERCEVKFYIIDTTKSILGLDACKKLKLVKRVSQVNNISINKNIDEILANYNDVFKGIGCMNVAYAIKVKYNAEPNIHPPRRVPFTLHDRLKNKLNELENLKIVEKVEGPTEWVNSMVIVPKRNGDLRICIDPK